MSRLLLCQSPGFRVLPTGKTCLLASVDCGHTGRIIQRRVRGQWAECERFIPVQWEGVTKRTLLPIHVHVTWDITLFTFKPCGEFTSSAMFSICIITYITVHWHAFISLGHCVCLWVHKRSQGINMRQIWAGKRLHHKSVRDRRNSDVA